MTDRQSYTGIDLGSNSFHMVVARAEHGQLRVIDRIRDMVRLAGGLDDSGQLDDSTRQQALATLARFGERIHHLPDHHVRAVGTQTFRRLANPAAFLIIAETTLGAPIDIVSGREEARLVWLGVNQGVAPLGGRSLVIDIGGGSTELVAGENVQPTLAESLPLGCVSLTRRMFPDGRISRKRYLRALDCCRAELQVWATQVTRYGWNQVIGTSGTIRALAAMITALDPNSGGRITASRLKQVRKQLLNCRNLHEIDMEGLSERRRPVIIGGLAILEAVVDTLGIDHLEASDLALREGLLLDLLERRSAQDPRTSTITAMMTRYDVDQAQAARVTDWTTSAFEQLRADWQLRSIDGEILHWISQTHEIGLALAHDNHHRHTAYILEHADMPGFSHQEQQFMAIIAGQQRRSLHDDHITQNLPRRLQSTARRLTALLRLAVTLHRARSESCSADFALHANGQQLTLALEPGWLDQHPLVHHDLNFEADQLARVGIKLKLAPL